MSSKSKRIVVACGILAAIGVFLIKVALAAPGQRISPTPTPPNPLMEQAEYQECWFLDTPGGRTAYCTGGDFLVDPLPTATP